MYVRFPVAGRYVCEVFRESVCMYVCDGCEVEVCM